jgi:nucleotide-binding universal stress UspA family protein
MKSILVPTGGSESDGPVFETALAAARLFSAHLRFVHIRVGPGEAAVYTPHVDFASGPALSGALGQLETDAERRSKVAERHVREFCARSLVDILDVPAASQGVTASWREEENDARQRLMYYARHNDLVVMGRAKNPNGLPPDIIEVLLLGCGRPILLASSTAPRHLTGTIMVCWRETPDAARAAVAAAPFLTRAERVVFVGVEEGGSGIADALSDVANQFRWCGVPTDTQVVAPKNRATSEVLSSAAQACGADLVVMGAYGHSRIRELVFGGCTQAVIHDADRPVLLLH